MSARKMQRSSWPFMVDAPGTGVAMEPAPAGSEIHGDGTGTALQPVIEAGTVDLDQPARCVGCGCTDHQACANGCSWLGVNRADGTGVCSNCRKHLSGWRAQQNG